MAVTLERGQCYTWGVGDYGKLGHGDTTPQLLPRHLEYFRQLCAHRPSPITHNPQPTTTMPIASLTHRPRHRRTSVRSRLDLDLISRQAERISEAGRARPPRPKPTESPLRTRLTPNRSSLTWVSGGTFHSAACSTEGKLFTWGGGTYGKLGHQNMLNSLTPRPVKNVTSAAHFVQV